jgi:flagellar assembly factor FliW
MSLQTPDAPAAAAALSIESLLLGTVTAGPDAIFDFPAGLFAFDGCRRFVLIPSGKDGLWWLQSAEHAELTFLLADPFRFYPGYEVQVPPTELAQLGEPAEGTVAVLVVVTLPRPDGDVATANLRAPVLLDARRRIGRQVVLPDERLLVTAPLTIG